MNFHSLRIAVGASLVVGLLTAPMVYAVSNSDGVMFTQGTPTSGIPTALLKHANLGQFKIVATFPALSGALTGYVLKKGLSGNTVVFGVTGADVLVIGNLIDATGNDLNSRYIRDYRGYQPEMQLTQEEQSQPSTITVDPAVPKALYRGLQTGKFRIVRTFKAAGRLSGYILAFESGRNDLVYGAQDSDVLITGNLIDASDADMNHPYLEQYRPKIDPASYRSQIQSAPSIVAGAQGAAVRSTVYVFMDPNCIFCHGAWREFAPYEKVGLQVRWIPLGFLKQDSMSKAAALLDSKDGPGALDLLEAKYENSAGEADTAPEAKVSPETKNKLVGNRKLFASLGLFGTPAMFFFGKDGKLIEHEGILRLHEIPTLTGLPEQKITDPTLLAHFQ